MYLKHFALLFYPFGKDIPPEEMYASTAMAELAIRLGHLIEMSGVGLVTGDSGSGNVDKGGPAPPLQKTSKKENPAKMERSTD